MKLPKGEKEVDWVFFSYPELLRKNKFVNSNIKNAKEWKIWVCQILGVEHRDKQEFKTFLGKNVIVGRKYVAYLKRSFPSAVMETAQQALDEISRL